MDPEVARQLEEQVRQATDMLAQMNATMASTSKNMQAAALQQTNAIKNLTNTTNQQNTAQNAAVQSTTKLSQINKESSEKLAQTMANFGSAFMSGKAAVTSFANALLSSERGFSKYGSSIRSAGDAAFDIGKNFGILGTIVGGAAKGLGMLAERAAKQADDINNYADTWKKTGAIGGLTNLELMNMTRKIGYASQDLEKFKKAMGTLGPAVVNLGGTAQSGQKMFLEIANIGSEARQKFNRLGLQIEDVNEYQAEYIKLQRMAGISYSNSAKDQALLKKRSLEYTENLIELAAITGESTDEIRRKQEIAQQEYQENVLAAANRSKIARLKAEGTAEALAEAERLEKAEQSREKMKMESIQFGEDMGAQIRDYVRSGRVSNENIAAYRLGGDALIKLKAMTDAGASEEAIEAQMAEVRKTMKANMEKNAETFGNTIQLMDARGAEEFGKTVVGGRELMEALESTGTRKTPQQQRDQVEGQIAQAANAGFDQAADFRAATTEKEIELKNKFDALLQEYNPFLGNGDNLLGKLADAAKAAALVIGGIVAAKVAYSGYKMVRGVKRFFSGGGKAGPAERAASAIFGGGGDGSAGAVAGPAGKLQEAVNGRDGKAVKNAASNPVANAVGGFLKGLAVGFKALGKAAPQVIEGSVAVGIAIAVIGAAVAAATWLMGAALPNLAKGLASFNNLNGKNLEAVGKGMQGLGVGILAMGGGEVLSAIGNFASIFSDEDPLQETAKKLHEFEQIEVDKDKIQYNAEAYAAFAKAFTIGATVSGLGEVTAAISDGVSKFFSKDPPFAKFVAFSNLTIDPVKTEINATAFKKFSEAMATYKGFGTINSLGVISSALAEAAINFMQQDPPLKKFEDFSKLKIDPKQTRENAIAFKDFANAMAEYKGGPGVMDVISSKLGGLASSILGTDGPVEAFKKFTEMDFGPNMEKNVEGFRKYAETINMKTAPSGIGDGEDLGAGTFSGLQDGYRAVGAETGGVPDGAAPTSSMMSSFDISKARGPWRKDPAFLQELDRVAKKYGFPSSSLIGLMMSESGINPQAQNPNGGATGLIQFMPNTARALGTSTSALYGMNRAQQMKYVDDFFGLWARPGGLSGASPGRLYAYVFLPGRAKREVLTTSNEKYYKANRGLDLDKDGKITISDLDRRVATKAMQARSGGFFTGPTTGYPMELHGTEMVAPVTIDSILMKLAKTPANEVAKPNKKPVDMTAYSNNLQLTQTIAKKLDDVIEMLEEHNTTSNKILKHSRA